MEGALYLDEDVSSLGVLVMKCLVMADICCVMIYGQGIAKHGLFWLGYQ